MAYRSITELARLMVIELGELTPNDTEVGETIADFKERYTRHEQLLAAARELRKRIETLLELNRTVETHARALAIKASKAANHITQVECPHCQAKTQPTQYCGACGQTRAA